MEYVNLNDSPFYCAQLIYDNRNTIFLCPKQNKFFVFLLCGLLLLGQLIGFLGLAFQNAYLCKAQASLALGIVVFCLFEAWVLPILWAFLAWGLIMAFAVGAYAHDLDLKKKSIAREPLGQDIA